jgi:hypothetical protein
MFIYAPVSLPACPAARGIAHLAATSEMHTNDEAQSSFLTDVTIRKRSHHSKSISCLELGFRGPDRGWRIGLIVLDDLFIGKLRLMPQTAVIRVGKILRSSTDLSVQPHVFFSVTPHQDYICACRSV